MAALRTACAAFDSLFYLQLIKGLFKSPYDNISQLTDTTTEFKEMGNYALPLLTQLLKHNVNFLQSQFYAINK